MAVGKFAITEKDGAFYLTGVMDEFAELEPLKMSSEPLRLHLGGLTKLNSIGIRNFLRFLADWGPRELYYEHATSEFIDQVNMIPSMRGVANQAKIFSFNVPWQCLSCDHEDESFMKAEEIRPILEDGNEPDRKCPKCNSDMVLLVDSYFDFLTV